MSQNLAVEIPNCPIPKGGPKVHTLNRPIYITT